jgi:hypothetical protein
MARDKGERESREVATAYSKWALFCVCVTFSCSFPLLYFLVWFPHHPH